MSPLHLAAQNGHYEVCDVLVRSGISKDFLNKVIFILLYFSLFSFIFNFYKETFNPSDFNWKCE